MLKIEFDWLKSFKIKIVSSSGKGLYYVTLYSVSWFTLYSSYI